MKRPAIHVLFWLCYLIQDTLFHYTWMTTALEGTAFGTQLRLAFEAAFILLPSKLLLVYYFLQFGLKKIMADNRKWFQLTAEISLVLVVTMVLFRATFHYVVLPGIYHLAPKSAIFSGRNILLAIIEMGYVTGIAIAFKLLRMQTHSKEREKDLIKDKLESELKFLRSQTNPHFLFNTLNNIYGLARRKSDKTPEAVMKLSELLSFMLYESNKETISVAEEIKMMEDYLDLERMRYSDRLSIRFDKSIDNNTQPIAPLLLLPLVENAFKHGVSETRFDSFVNINMELKEGRLAFSIENTNENGKDKINNNRIGLSNTRRQMELMYKEQELSVRNGDKIFKVSININLNSYGKI